ncbi:MAG: zinc ribbon domain-containing protein [Nitrosopumilus sp.]|nr:MAG: zinc ribbon domain-containing protein [Nitrosopumilus sp.]
MAKKFSDDDLDEVLSNIAKFDSDGIRYTHLKNNVKKNFVKMKIAEFKLKDILVFLDENGLVQRIPFDDNSGFHDLTVYRISKKGRDLISKFARDSGDDWNKSSYSSEVSCNNCGHSFETRVSYSETVKAWAKSQRCPNCAMAGTLATKSA